MLAGAWKGKVPDLAANCGLSVPAVITGRDYNLHVQAPEFQLDHAYRFDERQLRSHHHLRRAAIKQVEFRGQGSVTVQSEFRGQGSQCKERSAACGPSAVRADLRSLTRTRSHWAVTAS